MMTKDEELTHFHSESCKNTSPLDEKNFGKVEEEHKKLPDNTIDLEELFLRA